MDPLTGLNLSPRKKRWPPSDDEDYLSSPKKLRQASYVPPTPSSPSKRAKREEVPLPDHLQRIVTMQTSLRQALSHALATSAVSPTEDTGQVPNILNHISVRSLGLTASIDLHDLRRLCWLWEWDGKSLPPTKAPDDGDDNPFLVPEPPRESKWCRGAMGFIITPATHLDRNAGKRVPAYGIGIEVDMNIDKGFSDGMAAVARWTADGERRKLELRRKLEKWAELHPLEDKVPPIPVVELPTLRKLAESFSLKNPGVPSRSPSPTKLSPSKKGDLAFAVPLPITPASTPHSKHPLPSPSSSKSTISFPVRDRGSSEIPQTPTHDRLLKLSDAKTPSNSTPSTPSSTTPAQTPTSSRRNALYERIRQRSLSNTPTSASKTPQASKDKFKQFGAAEMRRRSVLGRLPNVAEGIWMLFSGPASSKHERRALPATTVIHSIVKSSPVPISDADAEESINLLVELCPFFLKKLVVDKKEWLEMPAPESPTHEKDAELGEETVVKSKSVEVAPRSSSPVKTAPDSPKKVRIQQPPDSPRKNSPRKIVNPLSPGRLSSSDNNTERFMLLTKSPSRVVGSGTGGGLRLVRERIRRELEIHD
ncbi:hypothetical protein SISNIDRAFT_465650 [Sistotremastrum niveocremeum HHB9708]|uniref:DNA replication factor Cdt1 C-terminal domain-containing protein n=2 Tax=Sistotremastraceae TaxID=3402574 RepID=A0A164VF92_9AGAM|nr:hypothetical protein SISNIDRAFT_465650 [Sistotremastrum niveocremeum HHB9708]KZT35588.1 hypothetical protein SISSUDRAFT_1064383 [Sistotremastrum suecicum HHB10207 ss-3]